MSSLALMEVHRGLYNKMQADAVLMSMIMGVYASVPQISSRPFVVIGDGACTTMEADALALSELILQIDVWTEASGRKTALTIMNRIYGLLHMGTLTLSGYQLVLLRCEQAETQLAEEATRVHGIMMVRAAVVEG